MGSRRRELDEVEEQLEAHMAAAGMGLSVSVLASTTRQWGSRARDCGGR
ncbi:hypothetical protein ACFL5O_00365 [Myxococcota bacterium]